MSDTRWKRAEREIAQALGGQRLPNNGTGQPDVLTATYAVQVKTTKQLPAWLVAAVEQARRDAGPDRLPLVVLNEVSQGRRARRLAVLDFDVWRQVLAGAAGAGDAPATRTRGRTDGE